MKIDEWSLIVGSVIVCIAVPTAFCIFAIAFSAYEKWNSGRR